MGVEWKTVSFELMLDAELLKQIILKTAFRSTKGTKRHEKSNYYIKIVIHQKGYAVKLYNNLISFVYFVLFVDNCFF
jgi:hypothetical protein